jgi:hypothetical protein
MGLDGVGRWGTVVHAYDRIRVKDTSFKNHLDVLRRPLNSGVALNFRQRPSPPSACISLDSLAFPVSQQNRATLPPFKRPAYRSCMKSCTQAATLFSKCGIKSRNPQAHTQPRPHSHSHTNHAKSHAAFTNIMSENSNVVFDHAWSPIDWSTVDLLDACYDPMLGMPSWDLNR